MMNIKIKRIIKIPRLIALSALVLLFLISLRHPLNAQTVTQGYSSDVQMQRGMIVNIKKDDGSKIELSTTATIDHIHGVVVDPNDAPVTLSNDGSKIFVATSGHFDVLVGTQNGPINAGDYITISALDGIGMKAGTREAVVVGRALASFDGKAGAISTTTIKDSTGGTHEVNIGRVKVDVNVARNPNLKAPEANLPEILQRASTAIAGKPVNPVRVYIGVIIFTVSTVIAGSLLYGGVRSAIYSIGRNPLSRKSIIRGMMQVIITGLIVFITGVFGVYLLLKI